MPHAHCLCFASWVVYLTSHPGHAWLGLQASWIWFIFRQAGRQARQAAPTCYMDRNKDHRIFLDRSNSFLHPSCPYWFGPFPPRCVPVALIKQQVIYPPQNESRCQKNKGGREEREDKEEKTKLQTVTVTKGNSKKKRRGKKTDATTYVRPFCHMVSTYLLHGHMKRPQHFPKSFKFFSASFMSWLIWFMPSSTRSSCSGQDKGMTAVEWILLVLGLQKYMRNEYCWTGMWNCSMHLEGDACIRMNLHVQRRVRK